jgi:hypothetical protein
MQSWYRPVIVSVLVGSLLLAGPLRWAEAGEPQEKVLPVGHIFCFRGT